MFLKVHYRFVCLYIYFFDCVRSKIRDINRNFFGSRPVVSVSGDCVMFNLDNLHPPLQQTMMVQVPVQQFVQQPVPVMAQAAVVTQEPQLAQQPFAAPPMQATVAGAPRVMSITVPAGAEAGSVLTVMSPDGQQVQVTVPKENAPGSQISVQY